ncbi:hypothetical protein KIPB_008332 [Kipferlia bialata]|uniref:Uncharacterized protein n=1 Tax=Kipferlia bialata TaxID=797122 RepID=A0A9K3D2M8_9EUKA|nr:hypothetical protein KIPB_008332 [Kipferlia bialata]|eukprot:g8332.t1
MNGILELVAMFVYHTDSAVWESVYVPDNGDTQHKQQVWPRIRHPHLALRLGHHILLMASKADAPPSLFDTHTREWSCHRGEGECVMQGELDAGVSLGDCVYLACHQGTDSARPSIYRVTLTCPTPSPDAATGKALRWEKVAGEDHTVTHAAGIQQLVHPPETFLVACGRFLLYTSEGSVSVFDTVAGAWAPRRSVPPTRSLTSMSHMWGMGDGVYGVRTRGGVLRMYADVEEVD